MPSVTGPSCVSRSDCCKARSTFAASLFPAASDPAAPDSRFSAAGSSAGASSASAGASSAAVSSVICGASDFASVVEVVLSSIMLAVSGAELSVFAPRSGRRLARPITSTQHAASAAHLIHAVLTIAARPARRHAGSSRLPQSRWRGIFFPAIRGLSYGDALLLQKCAQLLSRAEEHRFDGVLLHRIARGDLRNRLCVPVPAQK